MLANQNQGELLKWASCPVTGSGFYFLFWIIWNHSPDYSLICTPLSPITITNLAYKNEFG